MARHLFYPGDAPRGINSLGRDYACVLLKQCCTHLGIQLDARCTLDSPPSVDQRSSNLLPFLPSFSLCSRLPFCPSFHHCLIISLFIAFSLFLCLLLSFRILEKLSSYQRSRITSRVAPVSMISNVGGT